MAGDWMKIELSLPQKPEVIRIGRSLGVSPEAVCGWLIKFWGWVGANSVDGSVTQVALRDVDMVMSLPGFADALVSVGWLKFDDATQSLIVPNFERHNGESAKKRALTKNRQDKHRSKGNAVSNAESVTNVTQVASPEKRREDIKTSTAAPLPDWLPKEPWFSYIEMRNKIRKPLTGHGIDLAVDELLKLKAAGHDPAAVLEQSILHSWQGLFPPKKSAQPVSLVKRGGV